MTSIINDAVFIQQPYFLPWLGFFSKIVECRNFFCLDQAPFRRDYLHRAAVLSTGSNRLWLTCPIGASQGVSLSSYAPPKDPSYIDRIIKTIHYSYKRAQCFDQEIEFVEHILNTYRDSNSNLSSINYDSIVEVCKYIGIEDKKFFRESDFELSKDKNTKILEAMRIIDSRNLICGDGGSTKTHDIELLQRSGIKIWVLPFFDLHPRYPQTHFSNDLGRFEKGLSFIDALLNVGREQMLELISAVQVQPLCKHQ